jgi:ribosomal protein L17
MAGGLVKYRHLSRNSSARKALLRSQVTALVMHEHIQTTYAKAKETQRMAEKLITLAKRNTPTSRVLVEGMLYVRRTFRFSFQLRDGGELTTDQKKTGTSLSHPPRLQRTPRKVPKARRRLHARDTHG